MIKRIEPDPQDPKKPNAASITPSCLGSKSAKRLNAFISTCSELHTLNEHNYSSYPDITGSSLHSHTVRRLTSGLPFLCMQGKMSLGLAFPTLELIKMYDNSINLYAALKGFGDYDLGGSEKVKEYIEKVFGGKNT